MARMFVFFPSYVGFLSGGLFERGKSCAAKITEAKRERAWAGATAKPIGVVAVLVVEEDDAVGRVDDLAHKALNAVAGNRPSSCLMEPTIILPSMRIRSGARSRAGSSTCKQAPVNHHIVKGNVAHLGLENVAVVEVRSLKMRV